MSDLKPARQETGTRQLIPEWHPNRAVWLAWPSDRAEWFGDLEGPRRALAALIAAIADVDPETGRARGEAIHLLVFEHPDQRHPHEARDSARALLGAVPVTYHAVPYGDIWLRDTGPVFVARDGADGVADELTLTAACFAWNGWGRKYELAHDDRVAEAIAVRAGTALERHGFVLEGGAIDGDGDGTVLTTRQCLLNPNRNLDARDRAAPTAAAIERRLADTLGAERVIWLDRGLANDHTDGHVDTLARFVAPARVVCMRAMGADAAADPNRAALDDIAASLRGARDARGRALEVVEIPSPGRVLGMPDDALMPASYVNFYVGNTTVVVPTYGARFDDDAVAAIAALFPDRRTVGVDARAILTGGGAFHCVTKQQPALPAPAPAT
ncbi:MAG: agmatine deiminase family protein [Haliangiales bacterium]